MPLKFWADAFQTACFLINRVPSRVINFPTLLEKLFGKKPDYHFVKSFGFACWSNLRLYNAHKLQFLSQQCVFLGYSHVHKGYKCLDRATGRVYISTDVVFYEHVFPFAQQSSSQSHTVSQDDILVPVQLIVPVDYAPGPVQTPNSAKLSNFDCWYQSIPT